MKVIETHYYNNSDHSEASGIEVEIYNAKGVTCSVTIGEGEPEDMYLFRDLSDAYYISELIRIAYEEGKNGEDFEYELIEDSDD